MSQRCEELQPLLLLLSPWGDLRSQLCMIEMLGGGGRKTRRTQKQLRLWHGEAEEVHPKV